MRTVDFNELPQTEKDIVIEVAEDFISQRGMQDPPHPGQILLVETTTFAGYPGKDNEFMEIEFEAIVDSEGFGIRDITKLVFYDDKQEFLAAVEAANEAAVAELDEHGRDARGRDTSIYMREDV